jgi:hypothetical protein
MINANIRIALRVRQTSEGSHNEVMFVQCNPDRNQMSMYMEGKQKRKDGESSAQNEGVSQVDNERMKV